MASIAVRRGWQPRTTRCDEGDLLWVYEGLTQYLGDILAPRAGLWTKQQFFWTKRQKQPPPWTTLRERSWRPLQILPTPRSCSMARCPSSRAGGAAWTTIQIGFLIWLEADTIIRQQTKGQKSINDFCHSFHGGGNTPPKVITYNI